MNNKLRLVLQLIDLETDLLNDGQQEFYKRVNKLRLDVEETEFK